MELRFKILNNKVKALRSPRQLITRNFLLIKGVMELSSDNLNKRVGKQKEN